MKEVVSLIIGVLMFSLVMIGGTFLIGDFTGSTPVGLPGYSTGSDLSGSINETAGEFSDTAESTDSGLGVFGLVKLIVGTIIKTPIYVSEVIYDTGVFLGLPTQFAVFLIASVWITIIGVGILLLRGVK